ncbi:MAG TPA: hypothetical protein VFD13_03160 [Candidatus Kapabacteria bacterium]|nr:hypothetical protein [Candidatus Kapabacteria bacterium]
MRKLFYIATILTLFFVSHNVYATGGDTTLDANTAGSCYQMSITYGTGESITASTTGITCTGSEQRKWMPIGGVQVTIYGTDSVEFTLLDTTKTWWWIAFDGSKVVLLKRGGSTVGCAAGGGFGTDCICVGTGGCIGDDEGGCGSYDGCNDCEAKSTAATDCTMRGSGVIISASSINYNGVIYN